MALGELLVAKKIITSEELDLAHQRQRITRRTLEESLSEIGSVSKDRLRAFLKDPPAVPRTVAETGLSEQFVMQLTLKAMFLRGLETIADVSDVIALSRKVVQDSIEEARRMGYIEVMGSTGGSLMALRYQVSGAGVERVREYMTRSQYVGPAPVSVEDFAIQVQKQTVAGERVSKDDLARVLAHLVLAPEIKRQLGPALNAGKPVLLYGPTGNGKTSISESLGDVYHDTVYLPHCFEVDGQIIRVFDPALHRRVDAQLAPSGLLQQVPEVDPRYVPCRRPIIMAGGELTLDMLDLRYDSIARDYEAPLQVKASNGVLIIDDFGRQLVPPADLLNRWVVPLERRFDFLTLSSGKKFELPFDELVVFSTNLHPQELMDQAFLRRIHYKFFVGPPNEEDFRNLFHRACKLHHLALPPEILDFVLYDFYPNTQTDIAAFHPIYIVDHVIAACRLDGVEPELTMDRVRDSVGNLHIAQSWNT